MPDRTTTPARTAGVRPGPPVLVWLALGSCAVIYAAALLPGAAGRLLAVAGGVVWFWAYFAIRRSVQEAADLPDEQLDEREIALRDRSYLESYRVVGAAIACSLALALVDDAVDRDLVVSPTGPWMALLLLAGVLPSVVLARGQHRTRPTD